MRVIRLTQLNLETPVTNKVANSLTTSAESVQTISERITTISVIRVTQLNLEIPVSLSVAENVVTSQQSVQTIDEQIISPARDTLVNVGTSEQTILEDIIGTPVPTQVGSVPSAWVGGAVREKETLRTSARSEQTLTERISETFVSVAMASQSISTAIHEKRVFDQPDADQPVSIVPTFVEPVRLDSDSEVLALESPTNRAKKRQREEDELILLGILG